MLCFDAAIVEPGTTEHALSLPHVLCRRRPRRPLIGRAFRFGECFVRIPLLPLLPRKLAPAQPPLPLPQLALLRHGADGARLRLLLLLRGGR